MEGLFYYHQDILSKVHSAAPQPTPLLKNTRSYSFPRPGDYIKNPCFLF